MIPRFSLIFLCGGTGTRFKTTIPKQFLQLGSSPIALHSLQTLELFSPLEVCVVCKEEFTAVFNQVGSSYLFAKPGERRQDSVENGLLTLKKPVEFVLIHDGARPLIQKKDVEKLITLGMNHGAAALGVRAESTIRITDNYNIAQNCPERSLVWEIQTPQILRYDLLRKGLEKAKVEQLTITDDVAAAELYGVSPLLVEGSKTNIKITTQEDLAYAKFLLQEIEHA